MKRFYWLPTLLLVAALVIHLINIISNSHTTLDPAAAPVEELSTNLQQKDDVVEVEVAEVERISSQKPWVGDAPQTDEQGSVVVEIEPLNPNNPGQTLDFQVDLNTHSVDLGMDLATLATLETDTGQIVQATLWDAPRGGHHVSGTLSFPAGVNGVPILDGVTKMTIRLVDVDSPERIFNWER